MNQSRSKSKPEPNGPARTTSPRNLVSEALDRSRALGLDPCGSPPFPVDEEELALRRERDAELLRIAEPELAVLSELLSGVPHVAAVSDRDGVILVDTGNSERVRDAGFRAACDWAEHRAGANAIGTALYAIQPIAMTGRDHYRQQMRDVDAAAAPVVGPDDTVLGTLAIATPLAPGVAERMALVVQTARLVERGLGDRAAADRAEREAAVRRRIDDAVRRSEHRFRTTFFRAPIGMAQVAPDGRVLRANDLFCDIVGYRRDELHARTIRELTHPDDLDLHLAQVRKLLGGEVSSFTLDQRLVRRDGSPVWIRLQATLATDSGDADGFLIAAAEDVSRSRIAEAALRESEEMQRLLAEAGRVLNSSLDAQEILQRLTRLAVPALADCCTAHLVGQEFDVQRVAHAHIDPAREELLREFSRTHQPEWADSEAPPGRVLRTGEAELVPDISESDLDEILAYDPEVLTIARELRPRSLMIAPLSARGRVFGILIFIRSESSRRYGSRDLALAHDLAARAAIVIDHLRLFQAESAARQEAEQATRAMSSLITTINHELRTPLTAIMAYIDLLESQGSAPLAQDQRTFIGRIRSSATVILDLINQLLTLSRIDAQKEQLQLADLDVRDLAREASNLAEPLAAARGLAFRSRAPEEPVPIRTDPGKLRQIVLNLLSNAIKFTRTGEVELIISRPDPGAVAIQVRDTGVGIPAEHLETIFQPFERVRQPETRDASGTGLGLSIARRLARLLGGDITVESRIGEGSTFTLRLPSHTPSAAPAD